METGFGIGLNFLLRYTGEEFRVDEASRVAPDKTGIKRRFAGAYTFRAGTPNQSKCSKANRL
jgi:hypothetical protein